MKKHVLSSLIIFSIVLSPALRAGDPIASTPEPLQEVAQDTEAFLSQPVAQEGSSLDNTEPLAVDPETEDLPEEQGSPVGQGSNERVTAAKKRQWKNIIIAVCAVAVAVTALILVSTNDGHKK